MKKAAVASVSLALTAIGLVSLCTRAQAQIYVGGGGSRPTIEVNLDALDALPAHHAATPKSARGKRATRTRATRQATKMHPLAVRTFRDQNDEIVSYRGGSDAPMTYEQAVRMAGGTIEDDTSSIDRGVIESIPLPTASGRAYPRNGRGNSRPSHTVQEDTGYDSVDNLNRLAVECSAGNMLARGQSASVIPVADTAPMAPPVTSAGATDIPQPITTPVPYVPPARPARTRATPQPVDLPAAPQIIATPLPDSPNIRPSSVPIDDQPTPAPLPRIPTPVMPAPVPVAMVVPPVPSRLMPDDLKIDFAPNSESLPPDASTHLARLVAKLASSPDLRVELRSFATGSPDMASKARRLALSRALSVRSYLTGQGINAERIDVRALGDATNAAPGDRVDIFLTR